MRLLVLDRGQLLFHLVRRIVPNHVDVAYTASFENALKEVEAHTADAVVAELRHDHLPWEEFQDKCCRHRPEIPVLFQSSSESRAEETCLRKLCGCNRFITEPYHADELKAKVLEVIEEAERANGGAPQASVSALH